MAFACFDFNYFSLRGQMANAGLKPWNNKWWMVYVPWCCKAMQGVLRLHQQGILKYVVTYCKLI